MCSLIILLFTSSPSNYDPACVRVCVRTCVCEIESSVPPKLTAPTRVLLCPSEQSRTLVCLKSRSCCLAILRFKKQSTIIPGYVSHSVLWHIQ